MGNNDVAIDIPLEQVPTSSGEAGLRYQDSMSALRPTTTQETKAQRERHQFFRGRRHRTPQAAGPRRVGYDGEEDSVNAMGRLYKRILGSSAFVRYLIFVAPLAILFAIPIIIGVTAAKDAKIGGVRINWFFAWIEIVWGSLWVSKMIAHYLPYIFQIFAGVVSSGVRKYSMVIRSLEIPISLVGWSVCSLATFIPVMTRNPSQRAEAVKDPSATDVQPWETIVQEILGAAVCATLVFLAEKTIIQLISIDYHRKQFSFRIKESKHNIYLLGLLYEASRALFPAYCNEFAEEDYIISDQLNLKALGISSKNRSHHRSGSATPARILQNLGRYGDKITSAFGDVAHEITGREVFNPNSAHSVVVEALEKKRTSEALAKRIWMSFVMEGREALYQDDIMEVLGENRRAEAEEAFAAIDQDGNGDISLDEMIMTVTEFGRERKSIASSMHDVDQAINVLDNLLSLVVFIAVVMIFIAFLNKSFVTTLATAGTALLSLSFVFSVTAQEVLGSCIFVFVKHPFDVGDRIDIGLDQFIVEHISLLFTVLKRSSGSNCGRIVQIPNIVLNTLWVENISRSKAMSEQMEIDVFFGTSFDDVQILKNELNNFVRDKDNSRDFQPDVEIGVLGTTDQSKLMLQVEVKHKSNWANEAVRQARRSKFMCAMVAALKAVPIYAPGGPGDAQGSAANPNYGVSITVEEAKKNAEASAKKKEAARLYPLNKVEDSKTLSPTSSCRTGAAGLSKRENQVIDDLTACDPAADPSRDEATWGSKDDISTLGERQSMDQRHQDLEEVKGLLRRGSTRGKRKPYSEVPRLASPSVPTIHEPGSAATSSAYAYGQPSTNAGYENLRPSYTQTSYHPQTGGLQTSYQSSMLPPVGETSPIEMSQVGRSPSNPYRRPHVGSPPAQHSEEDDKDHQYGGDTRPYSGV